MWKNKSSIQAEFSSKLILIILVSIGLWCIIWIQDEYSTFRSESDFIRTEHIKSQKLMLKKEVSSIVKYINDMRKLSEKKLERSLKEHVFEAHSTAMNIYRENIESKSLPEIKKMIRDALRPVRFNGGRGYYFAVSMDGVEQLYPVHPEFEGKNLMNLTDSKGNFVIRDEINIIKVKKEGFVKNFWTKPGKNSTIPYPKISYVKYFKPLDWYLGTGEYLDQTKEQIQKEMLDLITTLKFGVDGYFFGSTYHGESLFSNGKITIGSGSVWNLTDTNGIKIIRKQREMVARPEGGFVSYSWRKLNTEVPSPKISFVQGIPDWGWIIGAGVYLDTIEKTILNSKTALKAGLQKRIIRSIFIMCGLLCLAYFWSTRISNRLQKSVNAFSAFIKTADGDLNSINPKDIPFREFKNIAISINELLIDRQLAQKALEKSEIILKGIFRTAPTGIGMVCDRIFQQANDRLCEMVGYERNELIGQSARILYPSDKEYNYVGKEKYKQIRRKDTGTVETKMRHKDGKIIDVLLSSTPIDLKDLSKGVTFTALDITYRKTKESELRESEEKYRSMMEAMDDAAYICSSDYHIEYMNPAMIRMTGRDAVGEICHKTIYDLDEKCPWCIHEKIMGGESVTYDHTNPKDNKAYHISSVPIFHSDQSFSMLTICRDITRFKQMELQLQQSQKMESIGTLAGGVAHDFNNILFPIVGYVEMLLEDVPKDSPLRDSLTKIHTGAMRAGELVKQILTFSRQENQEFTLMKLQPIIKEALKLIRSTIPATIEIKQDIKASCGAVKADPTQIHQIIMNLTTNAYHAMEKTGGKLVIRLKQIELNENDLPTPDMAPGTYACLTVADTGTGMDNAVSKKIFDPFFTTKGKGKGTGMGLSVVHGIVKNMGGAIQVYTRPEKGSEFNIYFPVEMPLFETQALQAETPIQGGTEHILLVDDENDIIAMEKKMLERLGYHVTSHTSSMKALEAFQKTPDTFDMVICDMAMPDMSGDKLAIELIKIRPGIPILICTGFSETLSEEKAASMGIRGFLLKPIIKKNLSQKIRDLMDGNTHAENSDH